MDEIIELVQPYIKEVLSNNGKHGWREIAAVNRFQNDLTRDDIYLDVKRIKKRLEAAKRIRHTKDKYYQIPFTLQPFQIFCIVNLFGWYYKESGLRRFRKFYFDIARKNGKTEFACMLAVIEWFYSGINGNECYFAATKRDQAAIGFETAKIMLKQLRMDSAYVRSRVRILKNSVTQPGNESKMQAVSADAKTLDGLSPNIGLIDEYHAHPTNQVLKVIETGMGARENPLLMITTTAGFNRNSPCFQYREVCSNVLAEKIDDDRLFPMIFSMDEDDDWEDSNNWYKCNPNLDVTISRDFLESQYNAAKNEGESSINEFKTKNLNIYTSSNISFITDKVWMTNSSEPVINKKMRYWAGLDLSTNKDLTVLTLLGEDGSVIPYFFCPEKKINDRDNRDGVDYAEWFRKGLIIKIPGNAIDKRIIKEKILELHKEFNLNAIIYDPWRATQLAMELHEKRVSILEMGQNYKTYTEVISELEKNALKGLYKHGGHPILRWNNENVMLKLNANGNMMFDKANTKTEGAKIDGMVSLAMAEFGRLNNIDKKYKGRGIIKVA